MPNWPDIKKRFGQWWAHEPLGMPLLRIVARAEDCPPEGDRAAYDSAMDAHTNVGKRLMQFERSLAGKRFYLDAYPNFDMNLGPGSLALYLGTEPNFQWDTLWFEPWVHDGWDAVAPFAFDENNRWFRLHLDLIGAAQAASGGRYLVNIPDIVENIDILAAMRGPQPMCYDLIDDPGAVKERIAQLDALYFRYYDAFYHIVRAGGGSAFTAFNIWGEGRTAKIQCDFCALMSPGQFREFVVPSLSAQCRGLDNSMFHLDGVDAVKHLDALLEIGELDAVQWTHGAGQPDGISEKWYEPIVGPVLRAGKSVLLYVQDGAPADWIRGVDRLLERYGSRGVYVQFPSMSPSEAEALAWYARRHWDPSGT